MPSMRLQMNCGIIFDCVVSVKFEGRLKTLMSGGFQTTFVAFAHPADFVFDFKKDLNPIRRQNGIGCTALLP